MCRIWIMLWLTATVLAAEEAEPETVSAPTAATEAVAEPAEATVLDPEHAACYITVTIAGFEGGECKLIGVYGDKNFLAIPAMDVSGTEIVIAKEEPLSEGLYYLLLPNKKNLQLMIVGGQKFALQTVYDDLIGAMKVTGSEENELLYQTLQYEAGYQVQLKALNEAVEAKKKAEEDEAEAEAERDALIDSRLAYLKQLAVDHPDSFFVKYKLGGQNPRLEKPLREDGTVDTAKQLELYLAAFWDGFDFGDARMLRTPVYHNKLERYLTKLTPQSVDAVIKSVDFIGERTMQTEDLFHHFTSFACMTYLKSKIMGGEAIYVHVVDKFLTDELTRNLDPKQVAAARRQANWMRISLLGDTGPDLEAINVAGEKESLYDIDAPIVILYIYDLDCSHCQERTPILNDVYRDWRSRGIEVFALCINDDVERWKAYIEQEDLIWHNVIDPGEKSRFRYKYTVDVTPELYVLAKDHKIVAMNLKPDQLDYIFERELKKLEAPADQPKADAPKAADKKDDEGQKDDEEPEHTGDN